MRNFGICLLFILFSYQIRADIENDLKNGDILFIQSKSSQCKALAEVMKSPWTHMGIAFKLNTEKLLVDNGDAGQWSVIHSGGPVRFDDLNTFLASGTQYTVKRFKEGINYDKAQKLFKVAKPFADRRTPYDIYFTTEESYCSGFVSLIYKKVLDVQLGEVSRINELDLKGPEAQKIIRERFSSKARAPFTVETWKEKTTITPVSIYNSPLLVPLP